YIAFYHHKLWIEAYLPIEVQFLTKLIANNFISAVLMFVMAYVYWRYMDGSVSNHFYGFTSKGVNLKPYFAMILIMLPLIYYASHQPDFLRSYPVYYAHDALTYFKVPEWILVLVFEVNYGFDFVATELFFRGLLVIGLSRYMGSACVLPMVTTYCFIHFGKPFGEALSSILGGYVLGIFAYKTRSIYGGVIIHLAVAYMMEVGGYLGNRYFIELP
ncbi:MAG TPA: CPBP family intramembrane glutamic endopeptidase, partial [Cytophagales bacterium]|nr:CPBP family intramembrane glutamic endopeptidase [Cytophagales bacterium]